MVIFFAACSIDASFKYMPINIGIPPQTKEQRMRVGTQQMHEGLQHAKQGSLSSHAKDHASAQQPVDRSISHKDLNGVLQTGRKQIFARN